MPPVAIRSPQRRSAKPHADPRYQAVSKRLQSESKRLARHAPKAQKAREASAATQAPANERMAGAKAKVVDQVQAAPTPKPQPSSFKAVLRAQIEQVMPKTLGDTEKFMDGGQSGGLKQSLQNNVEGQKQAATGPVAKATAEAPNPATVPKKDATDLPKEPSAAAPSVDGASAMPAPAAAEAVSLEQSKLKTQQGFADNQIKPESLQRANDSRFAAVTASVAKVNAHAVTAPAAFRAKEAGVLGAAGAQAKAVGTQGANLLLGARARGHTGVLSRQQQQAAKEAQERKQVADTIEGIFTRTKERVDKSLSGLQDEVSKQFDSGVDAALNAMKTYVDDKVRKYKFDRYLSNPLFGPARWFADLALGLPAEVGEFYKQGRVVFQTQMDALIERVASAVDARLAQAKAEVSAGQAEIKAYVGGLPANLQQVGQAAEKAIGERLTELSQGIDDKQNEIAGSLAQKYKEAFDKADESLQKMQEENKGLVDQFAEKLGEVITALREFKTRLLAVIKKGQETIQLILDDPIAFLGHLLDAVKGGFKAFVDNIWTHLKAGFMAWLFGALTQMGVPIPTDLSLPSILKLVLGVLGITYEKLRAKAVKLLGERAVSVIEKVVEYVKELIEGGPEKLWAKVKEDLSGLKDMVIGAIQSWLIETVVKQAVTKIVSMFNPAGAIVQAVIAIYNVVMFVVEKAQQLLTLVESVVNSIHAIATGNISSAVAWIEKSLANAIPVVIGFLARLLGLSGISQKIREFIEKIQDKVDKAIDKVIAKIVETAKKLFGSLKAGAKKLLQWWKLKQGFKVGGEQHHVFFAGSERDARLRVASTEMDLEAWLDKHSKADDKVAKKIRVELKKIETLRKGRTQKKDGRDDQDEQIEKHFKAIADLLPLVMGSGDWGTQSKPVPITYPKKALSLYRPVFLGPLVASGVLLDQDDLAKGIKEKPDRKVGKVDLGAPIKANGLGAWIAGGGVVKRCVPFDPVDFPSHGGTAPSGKLGIAKQFQVSVGSVFKYEPGDETPGGRIINKALSYYGYRSKKQDTDGDHVLETQLIGETRANVIQNLWPLDANQNRHGKALKTTPVEIPGQPATTLEAVHSKQTGKELWIMIKKTREV
jgi:DNA anti-recombination protein RmuC